MRGRLVILLLAVVILLGIPLFSLIVSSQLRSLVGELLPTPTSLHYEPVKQDMMVYFDTACGNTEGIYYYKISEDSNAVIGFIMSTEQFLGECK